jgi:ABC-type uncharacterized transport system permease subunit
MKRIATGTIMTVIAAGLFLLALCSEDGARLGVIRLGSWMVFIYAIVVIGLAQYRRWHWIAYRSAAACIGCCLALIFGMWLFKMKVSTKGCGIILFVLALTDITIGFFIPWKEEPRPEAVQK